MRARPRLSSKERLFSKEASAKKAPSRLRLRLDLGDVNVALFDLLGRDPDPVVVCALLQQLPLGVGNVPVHDRAVSCCGLTVGDLRGLHRVIDIDAETEQQSAQYHPHECLHDEILQLPPSTLTPDDSSPVARVARSDQPINQVRAFSGGDSGGAVTILRDFSSSGLKTNSLSFGVSMACTQTSG